MNITRRDLLKLPAALPVVCGAPILADVAKPPTRREEERSKQHQQQLKPNGMYGYIERDLDWTLRSTIYIFSGHLSLYYFLQDVKTVALLQGDSETEAQQEVQSVQAILEYGNPKTAWTPNQRCLSILRNRNSNATR